MAGYIGSKAVNLSTTGADINGNADVSGDLTVDTNTLHVDSTNNRVGIGTSSPARTLEVYSTAPAIKLNNGTNAFTIGTGAFVDGSNSLVFFDEGVGERMRIDSSGNVGIGTASPDTPLEVKHTATSDAIKISGNADGVAPYLSFENQESGTAYVRGRIRGASNGVNGGLIFQTGSSGSMSEAMRIDSSGNVGINESNPSFKLDVEQVGGDAIRINGGNDFSGLRLTSTAGEWSLRTSTADAMIFYDASSATERMRIDSSGNLLVGNTSFNHASAGALLASNGRVYSTVDGNFTFTANRLSSDGEIIRIQKDTTTVGSIKVINSSLICSFEANGSSGSGIGVHSSVPNIYPVQNGVTVDNTLDMGSGTRRWDDIYATNGTIQTSDRNEKQDIAELSEAEQRVAVAAKGLMRKFRWKDAVAEKGDEARTHFGIIAQDLQAAFAAEGLDAGDYAMFISSTWTDEETGEERTRMGVRYSELLAFIIGAL